MAKWDNDPVIEEPQPQWLSDPVVDEAATAVAEPPIQGLTVSPGDPGISQEPQLSADVSTTRGLPQDDLLTAGKRAGEVFDLAMSEGVPLAVAEQAVWAQSLQVSPGDPGTDQGPQLSADTPQTRGLPPSTGPGAWHERAMDQMKLGRKTGEEPSVEGVPEWLSYYSPLTRGDPTKQQVQTLWLANPEFRQEAWKIQNQINRDRALADPEKLSNATRRFLLGMRSVEDVGLNMIEGASRIVGMIPNLYARSKGLPAPKPMNPLGNAVKDLRAKQAKSEEAQVVPQGILDQITMMAASSAGYMLASAATYGGAAFAGGFEEARKTAVDAGMDNEAASYLALPAGLLYAWVEKAQVRGIFGAATGKAIKGATFKQLMLRTPMALGKKMLREGLEEGVQGVITELGSMLMGKTEWGKFVKEVGAEVAGGALMGFVFEAGGISTFVEQSQLSKQTARKIEDAFKNLRTAERLEAEYAVQTEPQAPVAAQIKPQEQKQAVEPVQEKAPLTPTEGEIAPPEPAERPGEADKARTEAEPQPTAKQPDTKRASKLRDLAGKMDSQIESKLNPAIGSQNVTARRARIAAGMRSEGEHLQKVQQVLLGMADAAEQGTLPTALERVTNKAQVDTLLLHKTLPYTFAHEGVLKSLLTDLKGRRGLPSIRRRLGPVPGGHLIGDQVEALKDLLKLAKSAGVSTSSYNFSYADHDRMTRAGIETQEQFDAARQAALDMTKPRSKEELQAREVAEMERGLIGKKIPGFFPTPAPVIRTMLDYADISEGMSVLEPSAGKGDIADVVRAEGIVPDVIEINAELRSVLGRKGHTVVGEDFLETTGQYDRIVMNPPFEKRQDIEHVRHAYGLLAPGGRLVSIMSAGPFSSSDTKSVAFRDWLDEVGGEVEQLPERAFQGAGSFRQTGVSARVVVIDKPDAAKMEGRPTTESLIAKGKAQKKAQLALEPEFGPVSDAEHQKAIGILNQAKELGGPALNAGQKRAAGIIGLYHYEAGRTKYAQWATAVRADVRDATTQLHLPTIWRHIKGGRERLGDLEKAVFKARRAGTWAVKKQMRQVTGQVDGGQKITMTPASLLRLKLQSASAGARQAVSESRKTRAQLIRMARAILPKSEQGTFMRVISRADTQAKRDMVSRAIAIAAAEAEQKGALAEYKKTLQAAKKLAGSDFGKAFPAYRDALRELTEGVDPARPMATTTRKLEGTRKFLQDNPDVRERMPDYVVDALMRLDKTPAADMTAAELQAATNGIKTILQLQKLRTKLVRKRKTVDAKTAKAEILANTESVKLTEEGAIDIPKRGPIRRLVDNVATNLPMFTYIMDKGNPEGPMTTWVDGVIQEATEEAIRQREVHEAEFIKILKKHQLAPSRELSAMSVRVPGRTQVRIIRLPNGSALRLSSGRLVALHMTAMDTKSREALMNPKGYVVRQMERGKAGKLKETEKQVAVPLSEKDLSAIEKALTPKERRMVKALREFFDYTKTPYNKVTVEIDGYEKANNPTYFPRARYGPDLGKTLQLEPHPLRPDSVTNWSAMMPRTGGRARLVIPDAMEAAMSHILHISAIEGYGRAEFTVNAIMADPDVRAAIERTHGKGVNEKVTEMIRRTWGQATSREWADRLLGRLRGRAASAILTLRLTTIVKQALSLPMAPLEIPARHIGPYFVPRPLTGAERRLARTIASNEYAPMLWARRTRGRIGRDYGDYMAAGEMQRLYSGKDTVKTHLGKGLRGGDSYAINRIILASYKWAKADMSGAPMREVLAEAGQRATQVTRWTQPTWDAFDRTILGGTSSEAGKAVTMFRSWLDKAAVATQKTYYEYQFSDRAPQSKARLIGKLALIAMVVSVLPRLFMRGYKRLVGTLRPTDEDRTWAEAILDGIQDMAAVLPFGSNVIRGIRSASARGAWSAGDAVNMPPVETVNDIVKAGGELGKAVKEATRQETYQSGTRKGEPKWMVTAARAGKRAGRAAGRLTGYPIEMPIEYAENIAARAKGTERFGKTEYYNALWKAVAMGNVNKIRKWTRTLKRQGAEWKNITSSHKSRGLPDGALARVEAEWEQ